MRIFSFPGVRLQCLNALVLIAARGLVSVGNVSITAKLVGMILVIRG